MCVWGYGWRTLISALPAAIRRLNTQVISDVIVMLTSQPVHAIQNSNTHTHIQREIHGDIQ